MSVCVSVWILDACAVALSGGGSLRSILMTFDLVCVVFVFVYLGGGFLLVSLVDE